MTPISYKQEMGVGGEFPGGPVVRTQCFHCRGHGFNPWGNKILHATWHGQKKKRNGGHGKDLYLGALQGPAWFQLEQLISKECLKSGLEVY